MAEEKIFGYKNYLLKLGMTEEQIKKYVNNGWIKGKHVSHVDLGLKDNQIRFLGIPRSKYGVFAGYYRLWKPKITMKFSR